MNDGTEEQRAPALAVPMAENTRYWDRESRSAYSASFLAGVAAYWWWWYASPIGAREGVVPLVSWFAMGLVASLGAGRAALLLGHRMPDAHLSLTGRALGYVGGCGVAVATPETWLEVVDLAGLLFIMLLALGCLVGMGEIAVALAALLRKRRGPAATGEGSGGAPEARPGRDDPDSNPPGIEVPDL
jgi:hypothetical protein